MENLNISIVVLTLVVGYLIGAVSSARIVTRLFGKGKKTVENTELSLNGSDQKMVLKTVSATSVSVHIGSKYGFLTYVLDVIKVFVPVMIVKAIYPGQIYFLFTAFGALVGHVWPIYYGFRGGRGISVIYGTLFAIDWIGVFATSIPGMLIGLILLRDMLSAYFLGVLFVIPWLWFRTHNVYYLYFAIAANVVFTLAMIPEIKRWIVVRKDSEWGDPTKTMELSGMGRGLLKMGRKMGWIKKRENTAE
ncbi:MAG: glycerol-3-phosphate acyltransferase [Candidatus Zixiibacteriota bacterium]|jgi:glycerol-3-phosphate acyltransferase PlsY